MLHIFEENDSRAEVISDTFVFFYQESPTPGFLPGSAAIRPRRAGLPPHGSTRSPMPPSGTVPHGRPEFRFPQAEPAPAPMRPMCQRPLFSFDLLQPYPFSLSLQGQQRHAGTIQNPGSIQVEITAGTDIHRHPALPEKALIIVREQGSIHIEYAAHLRQAHKKKFSPGWKLLLLCVIIYVIIYIINDSSYLE